MAEVFGVVTGTLSVAALFNNCVDCFNYIQLSRQFGRDFERCQLKLDISRVRLGRWGEAVKINQDPRFATDAPADEGPRQARMILEEIDLLFQAVRKSSKRYELSASQGSLALFRQEDMQPAARGLHGQLGRIASQRQKQTGLLKKAAWALYDGKHFDKLVEQIKGFIDDLEKLVPAEATRGRPVDYEIQDIDDEMSLLALRDAAADTDESLFEAVERKVASIGGRNQAQNVTSEDTARVRVGNEWAATVLASGANIADQTTNSTDQIKAKGGSAVHIGNQYGGRGIFE